jgi:hypothetical protein
MAKKTTKKTKTPKKTVKKTTKKTPRNTSALAAKSRKSAGPMRDKRTSRGGAKNKQAELTLENQLMNDDNGLIGFTSVSPSAIVNNDLDEVAPPHFVQEDEEAEENEFDL